MLSTNVFIYKPVPWFIKDMKGSLLRHAWLTGEHLELRIWMSWVQALPIALFS